MLTSIVGINWGDEGKGRMVDLLSKDYDIVCRYQGGNNAGHTVINERGKFILNLLPSGILREGVVCVMGPGMVIDIKHLAGEMARLREAGISITPDNLKISDRAVITMPYHVQQDCLEEARLADKKFGSTKRGIAFVYADKYMKKAFRMGELLNLTIANAYGAEPVKAEDIVAYFKEYGAPLQDYICDVGLYLNEANKAGKKIMLEAQLGALRDLDYGIYPYTSSSNNIAAYGPIGAGVPNLKLDKTIGIMKAYSTCVGEGPFTAEYFGEKAEKLRKAGGEYGAATGRALRRGRLQVRHPLPGRGRNRAHQARRSFGARGAGGVRRLRAGRQKADRVPVHRRAGRLQARVRKNQGLELRHFQMPQKRGLAPRTSKCNNRIFKRKEKEAARAFCPRRFCVLRSRKVRRACVRKERKGNPLHTDNQSAVCTEGRGEQGQKCA